MVAPTQLKKRSETKTVTDNLEKDDVELRLEKTLFGDDAGFLQSLTKHELRDDRALVPRKVRTEEDNDEEDGEEDLEDVADEDVSIPMWSPWYGG